MSTIAVEEQKVFNEMCNNYNRKVTPSAEKGYNHFMKAWNDESGRRYLQRLTDDSVTIIYRKSLKQLQEYYDKLEDIRAASMEAQDSGNRRLRNLHQVLRQASKNTAPPVIEDAAPRIFPDGDAANIPSGHPFVLNSSVAMATVGRRRVASSVAPYAVPAAKQQCTENTRKKKRSVALNTLPQGLSFRQICKLCGRKRTDHLINKDNNRNMFGEKYCHWKTCGKCGAEKIVHDRHSIQMGYFCSLTVSQGAQLGHIHHYESHIHRN